MKQKFLLIVVLFSLSVAKLNAQQLKGDPWIFEAYKAMYNRAPTAWELNIKNYNNGSWNSYNDLATYILQYQSSISNSGVSVDVSASRSAGNSLAVFYKNGTAIAVDLITNDGGTLVATGGGNIALPSGANIALPSGANFSNLPGVTFGLSRGVLSAGAKRIPTSGSGALIIK